MKADSPSLGAILESFFSRLLKNSLERNSASFPFLLSEAEVHLLDAPTWWDTGRKRMFWKTQNTILPGPTQIELQGLSDSAFARDCKL